jgi:hypothetical protein|uniref:Uncharacterized protein n=1 Tax=Trebouxiophyceae sp. MX-AZ01 TaxID=1208065 RepID=J7KEF0_9CHLO|nr:hypothetical protein C311_p33 [Trebouxiophyceae sp. MX-AZ01]AFQ93745.1 hypothetical protein [Trebouxiophyceae sp. MX-AZ01]
MPKPFLYLIYAIDTISNRLRSCWFWRGRPLTLALWLHPPQLLVIRFVLLSLGYPLPLSLYAALYILLLLGVYLYLFSKDEDFFVGFYSSPIMVWFLTMGCRWEEWLFQRGWRVVLLSFGLAACVVSLCGGLLPVTWIYVPRTIFSLYLGLRVIVLYEGLQPDSRYLKEIPAFQEGLRVFHASELLDNQALSVHLTLLLLLIVQLLGMASYGEDNPQPDATKVGGGVEGGDYMRRPSPFRRGCLRLCVIFRRNKDGQASGADG